MRLRPSITQKSTGNNLSQFILNENTDIFRQTLTQINKGFYKDFENTTLRAFNLENMKEEDFKVLKQISLRRQNLTYLNKLAADNDSEGDMTPFRGYKKLTDIASIVKNIVDTKSSDEDFVLSKDPRTYVQLLNAYREYKENMPKGPNAKKILEKMKNALKKATIKQQDLRRTFTRNSLMDSPTNFEKIKTIAENHKRQRQKRLKSVKPHKVLNVGYIKINNKNML